MSQSRHQTSLGVTGCRKEIAKDRDNVARSDVARCRKNVEMSWRAGCRARSLEFTKRQQSRRLRSTLRHYNRIPPDWGVSPAELRELSCTPAVRSPTLTPRPVWLAALSAAQPADAKLGKVPHVRSVENLET